MFTSVLWLKFENKRPTTTKTLEWENINIILQDTTRRTSLKKELVRVAHERMLEALDNDSIRRIFTREAHRFRAISGTAAPPLPNKSTGTARAIKTHDQRRPGNPFRITSFRLRTRIEWKSLVSSHGTAEAAVPQLVVLAQPVPAKCQLQVQVSTSKHWSCQV